MDELGFYVPSTVFLSFRDDSIKWENILLLPTMRIFVIFHIVLTNHDHGHHHHHHPHHYHNHNHQRNID